MPTTAEKRAQARRQNRIQAAHAAPGAAPSATVRYSTPQRRPGQKQKQRGFFSRYPVATFLGLVLAVGLSVFYLHQNQIGPFAPPVIPQATCDLKTHHCNKAPIMTINPNKTYTATIKTAKGDIVIALDAKNTPIAVNNFVFLAQQHYYDKSYFWRVEAAGTKSPLDGSASTLRLIQGGSISSKGLDNPAQPGYTFSDERVIGSYTAGDVALANTGRVNTNSSQFFICTGDNSKYLAKSYTIFGHVTSGLDVALKMAPADIIETVTITVK